MFSRNIQNVAAPLVVATAMALAGSAQAETAPARSMTPAMGFGDAALPPEGFLDLCQRAPAECAEDPAAIPDLAVLRAQANSRFWQDAFARRRGAPAALGDTPPAYDWSVVFASSARGVSSNVLMSALPRRRMPAAPATTVMGGSTARAETAGDAVYTSVARRDETISLRPDTLTAAVSPAPVTVVAIAPAEALAVDVASVEGLKTLTRPAQTEAEGALSAEDVAVAALDTLATPLAEASASAAGDVLAVADTSAVSGSVKSLEMTDGPDPVTFELDRSGWALVNGVNRRINRAIRRMADDRQYGRADYWARPEGPRARGDCEDYVLAKRRALIAEGVPAAALSIAIVETRWGETHAVLLIATGDGEFVLDNLTPWVSRWDRVNYTWRERQRPGRPFDWVRATI